MAEQAKIEAQLLEVEGMRDIQVGLELAHISEDEQMRADMASRPPRPIEAKLRALEKFVRVASPRPTPPSPFPQKFVVVICPAPYPRVSDLFLFFEIDLPFRAAPSANKMGTRCQRYHLKKP